MYAMESASEYQVVITVESLKARRKSAVIDEATSFVDDEESEHDPGVISL